MKVKLIRGTTLNGKTVDEGAILDLDERNYNLFVKVHRDAVPYADEPPKGEEVKAAMPTDDKKGKK